MRCEVVTAAPEVLSGWSQTSMIGRGQAAGALEVVCWDVREYGLGSYGAIDDYPYGGGAGMLLRPEPLAAAIEAAVAADPRPARTLLLCPQGEVFSQTKARELADCERLVLVCGRYEGLDERVREALIDEEVSVGDYVLTGGELAAMVVIEATARLQPGVLGDLESTSEESHSEPLLEYPQYTRPAVWRGHEVPEVLLAGHHERVRLWRRQEQLRRTLERRPDLAAHWRPSEEDRRLLARIV